MKHTNVGLIAGFVLAGCVQQPAPVVSGYQNDKPILRRMADGEAPRLLEPAHQQAEQSHKTIGGVPVMEVSKVEDLPPPQKGVFNVEPAAGPSVKSADVNKVDMSEQPAEPRIVEHTVTGTDSLYKLASDYNTTVNDIVKRNSLANPADIKAGQVLSIEVGEKQPSAWQEMRKMLAEDNHASAKPAETEIAKAEPVQAAPKPIEQVTTNDKDIHWLTHKVQQKETIYRISKAYNVSVLDIMAANDFEKPQDLKYGTEVRIPVTQVAALKDKQLVGIEPAAGDGRESDRRLAMLDDSDLQRSDVSKEAEAVAESIQTVQKKAESEKYKHGQIDLAANKAKGPVWPVKGKIVRKFGDVGAGVAYTGINIEVPEGTPVLASDAGTVLYADDGLKIYGKLVLLRHDNGMVSAYAHNGKLLVEKGEHVKKGQIIAVSGATGNVERPQLHFELRQHASAVDPMRVLPKL